MITRPKDQPGMSLPSDHYYFNPFFNPSLAKLTLKLTPRLQPTGTYFVYPLNMHHNAEITQSIPIHHTLNCRIALLMKYSLLSGVGRSQVGTAVEWRLNKQRSIKTRVMMGSFALLDIQLEQKIAKKLSVTASYSSLYDQRFFHLGTLSLRYRDLNLTYSRRIDKAVGCSAEVRKSFRTVAVEGKLESDPTNLKETRLEIGISYDLTREVRFWAGVTTVPIDGETNFKFNIEKVLKNYGNAVLFVESREDKSVFYLGFRGAILHIAVPFLIVDSVKPLIFVGLMFLCGLAWRKTHKMHKQNVPLQEVRVQKSKEQRIDELRLIADKANELFQRQKAAGLNGLLIDQAFVGPQDILLEFLREENRPLALLRNQRNRDSIHDVTVSMRFYVSRHQLRLRKGERDMILGYYGQQDDILYVMYEREGRKHERLFRPDEAIVI